MESIANTYKVSKHIIYEILYDRYLPKDNIECTPINSFEDYMVDKYGNIYGKNGNKLKYTTSEKGYNTVRLYQNSKVAKKRVHRIVAEAFIPNLDNLPEVNHIDGNKTNNNVNNLEWCNRQYNMRHATDVLGVMKWSENRKPPTKGNNRNTKVNKLKPVIIEDINKIIHNKSKWGFGKDLNKIANKYGMHVQTIRNILNEFQ